ncbi:MAG: OmpA family protein, partial [Smithella sp.]|nr:OmpA family protein [Smithella sp.]
PPPPKPKPVIIEKGRQTLDVKFAFDKSTIKDGYSNDIDDLSQVMKDYPELNVVVEGHTDSIGSDAYNETLSQERADAVKNYMVEKNGINANRIKAIGFGEKQPVASNDTREGRAQNRRVEAVVDYIIER